MAEIVTLSVPVPSVVSYRVDSLLLNWGGAYIRVGLIGPNGEAATREYSGPQATTLMIALNKANLSTTSLHKRILNQLIADGLLAGVIGGSPD
jgi:hypothetical protein